MCGGVVSSTANKRLHHGGVRGQVCPASARIAGWQLQGHVGACGAESRSLSVYCGCFVTARVCVCVLGICSVCAWLHLQSLRLLVCGGVRMAMGGSVRGCARHLLKSMDVNSPCARALATATNFFLLLFCLQSSSLRPVGKASCCHLLASCASPPLVGSSGTR